MLRSLPLLALLFLCVPSAHALTLIENKTAKRASPSMSVT